MGLRLHHTIASALAGAVLLLASSAVAQVPGGVGIKPPFVTGDCVKSAGAGAISTSGSPCGGGGGSGTVNAGTLGQTGYYATAGTAISGSSSIILTATGLNIHPFSLGSMDDVVVGSFVPQAGNFTTIGATSVGSGIFTTLTAQTSLTLGSSSALTGTSGNGTILATTSGTLTPSDCVSINASGNLVAAGGPCTTGGGGGTVTSSTAGQLAWYASTGTTVIGNANITAVAGAVRFGQATSVAGSLLLSGGTSGTGTIRVSAAAGTPTFWLPTTNGTANQPLLSQAGSGAMTWGSLSGNTSTFGTTSGTLTSGNCVQIDASGNLVDSGGVCSGSAVINAGTTGQATYYAANGTTVSGTSALILTATAATMSPSGNVIISPAGSVTVNPTTAGTLNNIAIGGSTPLAGIFTTVTAGTSLTLNGSTALTSASGTGAILVTSTGSQTNGRCVTIDASGNHVAAAAACGAGTVTSVDVSGGTTGLTTSGGPITSTGTITLAGTLAVANGGTGQTSYTNGQLLIGNTSGNTLAKATLTQGSGISITNGGGSITIAATGTAPAAPSVQTANFNAAANGTYCVDTTGGAVTATLPASPANGDTIAFWDCLQRFAIANLILGKNSLTIMNSATDLTVNTSNANFHVTYVANGSVTTWIMW